MSKKATIKNIHDVLNEKIERATKQFHELRDFHTRLEDEVDTLDSWLDNAYDLRDDLESDLEELEDAADGIPEDTPPYLSNSPEYLRQQLRQEADRTRCKHERGPDAFMHCCGEWTAIWFGECTKEVENSALLVKTQLGIRHYATYDETGKHPFSV